MTKIRTDKKDGHKYPIEESGSKSDKNSPAHHLSKQEKEEVTELVEGIAGGKDENNNVSDSAKDGTNGIEVVDVTYWEAENNGVDYKITKYGTIEYEGGFEKVLETIGAKELSDDDIRQLVEIDSQNGNTDVDPEDFDGQEGERLRRVVDEYGTEKEKDNTYNYTSAIDKDLNYGFFEVDDRKYLAFATHMGGDVRGNYSHDKIFDITDVDTGTSGDPEMDVGLFMNPELEIRFKFKGKEFMIRKDGGQNGFYDIEGWDGDIVDDKIEKEIKGEYDIPLFNAYEKYAESNAG